MYFVLILTFVCVFAEEVPYPPNCNCTHLLYSEDLSTEPTPTFPPTSFTCWGRYDGYYADIEVDCTIFHYCQTWQYPTGLNETVKWDFACPRSTIFNQKILSCTLPNNSFDCQESPNYYWVNYNLTGTQTTPEPTTSFTNTGIGNQLIGGLVPQSGEYLETTPTTGSATLKPENPESSTSGNTHPEETVSQSSFVPSATTKIPESVSLGETSVSNQDNTGAVRPQSDRFPDSSFTSASPELIPSDSSQNHQSDSVPASHYPNSDSSEINPEPTSSKTVSPNFEDLHSSSDRFPGSTTPTAYVTQVPEFIASVSSQGHLDNNSQTKEPHSTSRTAFTTSHVESTYGASSEDYTDGFTTQSNSNFYTEKETKLPSLSQDHHKPEQESTTQSSFTIPFSENSTPTSESHYGTDISPQSGDLPDSTFWTPQVITQQDNDPHISQHPESNSSNVSHTPSDSFLSETFAPTPEYEHSEEFTSPVNSDSNFTSSEQYFTQIVENYDHEENDTSDYISQSGFSMATTTPFSELLNTDSNFGTEHTEPQLSNFPGSSSSVSSSVEQQTNSPTQSETSFELDFTTVVPGSSTFDFNSEKHPSKPDVTTLNPEFVGSDSNFNSEFSVSDQETEPLVESTTSFLETIPVYNSSSENYAEQHPEKPNQTTPNSESESLDYNSEHNFLDSDQLQTVSFSDSSTSFANLIPDDSNSNIDSENYSEQHSETSDIETTNPEFNSPNSSHPSENNVLDTDQQQTDSFPDSLPDFITNSTIYDSSFGNYSEQHTEKPDTSSSNPMFDNPDPDYNSPPNFSESDQQQPDPFLVFTTLSPDPVPASSNSDTNLSENFTEGVSNFTPSNPEVVTSDFNQQKSTKQSYLSTSSSVEHNPKPSSYPSDSFVESTVSPSNDITSKFDQYSNFVSTSKLQSSATVPESVSVKSIFINNSSDGLTPPSMHLLPPFYSNFKAFQPTQKYNHSESYNFTESRFSSNNTLENPHNSSAATKSPDNPTAYHQTQIDSHQHTYKKDTFSEPTHTPDSTISDLTRLVSGIISSDQQKIKKSNIDSIHFPQSDSISSDKKKGLVNKPSVKHNLQAIIFPQ